MSTANSLNMPIITVSTSHDRGVAIVHVGGEVDMYSVTPFADAVRDALALRPAGLVIDLLKVTFCGSSGLHVLVQASQDTVELRVVATGVPVLRALDVSGLTALFHVHKSVASAVNELAAPAYVSLPVPPR